MSRYTLIFNVLFSIQDLFKHYNSTVIHSMSGDLIKKQYSEVHPLY